MIRRLIAALLISVLSGCGTYWFPASWPPVQVTGVIEVDHPCAPRDLLGCFHTDTGLIEVKKGLPPHVRDCVLRHEWKHSEAWDHDLRPVYAIDCGDGTIVQMPLP